MAKFEGTVAEHLAEIFADNNAGLMGVERATDVTPGGDREYGAFGQAQSEFVAVLNDPETNTFPGEPHYGQWLQDYFFIV